MAASLHIRSIRLVLRACIELTEGRDVVVVAFTREAAVGIAQKVCRAAKGLGLPCANVEDSGAEPRVSVRAYCEPPKLRQFQRPTTVLFDWSARFDRAGEWALVQRCRLVVTSEDGRVPVESGEGQVVV